MLCTQTTNAQTNKRIDPLVSINKNHKILVAAHRGDWRNAPENSLRAFESAAAMGVDIVELDLKKTKDGVLIIMHDKTIDRTTNGKGKPEDYTLAELKALRLKNGMGRITDHTIPTLAEVMTALKGKVMVNLDKSYEYFNEAFTIVKETGTLRQAIFKAEAPYAEVQQRYPGIQDSVLYMPVINLDKPLAREIAMDYLKYSTPYAFEFCFEKDTSALISDNVFIRKTGAAIWINSLWASLNAGHHDDRAVEQGNTKDSWQWLIDHGATMLQTDRPRELIEYLKTNGYRGKQKNKSNRNTSKY